MAAQPKQPKQPKPLLSPAFVAFVQHLDDDERERVTNLRANSPQESDRPRFYKTS